MPTLNHSQIDSWQSCPLRWKLQQLDKAPETPQPALFLGRAVHTAIEADSRCRMETGAPLCIAELFDAGQAALSDECRRHDPDGQLTPHAPTLAARLVALLAVYAREVRDRLTPLAVEQSFAFPIPDLPEWTFTGRIDALIETGSGQRVIVDYKTAERFWQAGREHGALQATAYLWAFAHEGLAAAAVLFIPLVTTHAGEGYAAHAQLRRTERTPAQIAGYQRLVQQVALARVQAEADGQYPAKPGRQCHWCPVAACCPHSTYVPAKAS